MLTINAKNLQTARKNKRWSQDQLAQIAKVEKGTISRMERGEMTQTREKTAGKLSSALGISIDQLIGSAQLEAKPAPGKSVLSATIVNRARNALELVKRRYNVPTATVLELAPLLFFVAAEQMLKERKERIALVKEQLAALKSNCEAVVSAERHRELSALLTDLDGAEKNVASRELFDTNARPLTGDTGESSYVMGPFDEFLRKCTEAFPNTGYDIWEGDSPFYRICFEEASELTGSDDDALTALMTGHISLNEIPRELMASGKAAARKHWFAEQASKAEPKQ